MKKNRQAAPHKLTANQLADNVLSDLLHPEQMQRFQPIRPQRSPLEDLFGSALTSLVTDGCGGYGYYYGDGYEDYEEYEDDEDYEDYEDEEDYGIYDIRNKNLNDSNVEYIDYTQNDTIRSLLNPILPDQYTGLYRDALEKKLPTVSEITSAKHVTKTYLFSEPLFFCSCLGIIDFSVSAQYLDDPTPAQLAVALFVNKEIPCYSVTATSSFAGVCLEISLDGPLRNFSFTVVLDDQATIIFGTTPQAPVVRFKRRGTQVCVEY